MTTQSSADAAAAAAALEAIIRRLDELERNMAALLEHARKNDAKIEEAWRYED